MSLFRDLRNIIYVLFLISDGCLAHKTAVAVAALTLYVRYLIEDPLLSIVDPLNGI